MNAPFQKPMMPKIRTMASDVERIKGQSSSHVDNGTVTLPIKSDAMTRTVPQVPTQVEIKKAPARIPTMYDGKTLAPMKKKDTTNLFNVEKAIDTQNIQVGSIVTDKKNHTSFGTQVYRAITSWWSEVTAESTPHIHETPVRPKTTVPQTYSGFNTKETPASAEKPVEDFVTIIKQEKEASLKKTNPVVTQSLHVPQQEPSQDVALSVSEKSSHEPLQSDISMNTATPQTLTQTEPKKIPSFVPTHPISVSSSSWTHHVPDSTTEEKREAPVTSMPTEKHSEEHLLLMGAKKLSEHSVTTENVRTETAVVPVHESTEITAVPEMKPKVDIRSEIPVPQKTIPHVEPTITHTPERTLPHAIVTAISPDTHLQEKPSHIVAHIDTPKEVAPTKQHLQDTHHSDIQKTVPPHIIKKDQTIHEVTPGLWMKKPDILKAQPVTIQHEQEIAVPEHIAHMPAQTPPGTTTFSTPHIEARTFPEVPVDVFANIKSEPLTQRIITSHTPVHSNYIRTTIIVLLIIICGSLLGLGVGIYITQKHTPKNSSSTDVPIPQTQPVTRPTSPLLTTESDSTFILPSTHDELMHILSAKRQGPETGVVSFTPQYPVGDARPSVSTQDFMTMLAPRAQGSFIRSLGTHFVIGTLTTEKKEPYLIFETTNFDTAFAGMLAWETSLQKDLSSFFFTRQTDTSPENANSRFMDTIQNNKPIRVQYDASGQIQLLYAFLSKDTVCITTSIEALKVIISRIP